MNTFRMPNSLDPDRNRCSVALELFVKVMGRQLIARKESNEQMKYCEPFTPYAFFRS